jgi:hypothetical protein
MPSLIRVGSGSTDLCTMASSCCQPSAHLLPDVRVVESLGSGQHLLGACSQFHGKR